MLPLFSFSFFFFNDTATTEIYTLSLHDALPISVGHPPSGGRACLPGVARRRLCRSEEHTSELQSPKDLVCRLLLEKKNNKQTVSRQRKEQSSASERKTRKDPN